MVDALVLGTSSERIVSSSLSPSTTLGVAELKKAVRRTHYLSLL